MSLWPASLFGVVSILLITPLIALLVRFLPVNEFVGLGITSFAVAPTTVSSGWFAQTETRLATPRGVLILQ